MEYCLGGSGRIYTCKKHSHRRGTPEHTHAGRKTRLQSRNHGSCKFRSTSAFYVLPHPATLSARSLPISQSVTITGDGSFICFSSSAAHIAKAMRLCVILDATWLLQQVIRIHRFPLMSLSSSPRPLVHSLHRLHNRFFLPSILLCTINKYSH